MDASSPVNAPATSSRRAPGAKLSPRYVLQFVDQLVGEDLHAKRVLSLSNGVVGVLHAAALAVHFIGEGLSAAMGTDPKHAVKQVDRLLSNSAISSGRSSPGAIRRRPAESPACRSGLD